MTAITDTFFAPEREPEYRAPINQTAWRPLLVSFLIHLVGAILVIVISQIGLSNRIQQSVQPVYSPSINARLYYPSTRKILEEEHSVAITVETPEEVAPLSTVLSSESDNTPSRQTPNTPVPPNVVSHTSPPQKLPETQSQASQQPNVVTTNANQRAGRLNLSAKDAATEYFNHYHQQQIADEAQTAASEFQQRKKGTVIEDPRKGMPPTSKTSQPVKKVNCTSTVNKTLAILSGITGGTLACTKMDDHNRFIDARIKSAPKEDN
ncbi:hypothetical protein D210916BOD24_00820 [Alteromonas sp. D210916BOD_24]|uniref:hypothetical protein n=1 Tax=Alteromonas sp. D210916BOD_24 TaxID=3157618 RepID=UPI00399C7B95